MTKIIVLKKIGFKFILEKYLDSRMSVYRQVAGFRLSVEDDQSGLDGK